MTASSSKWTEGRPAEGRPAEGRPAEGRPAEGYAVPAGRVARGRVQVPSSKSVTHRYLALALLADAPLVLERPLVAEDTLLFAGALAACGFTVERQPDAWLLTPGPPPAAATLDCGNAGTVLRLLVAALATRHGVWTLDGTPRLRQRPVGPLVGALRRLGTQVDDGGRPGYPPLTVHGAGLPAGSTTLDAGESSQYLSALLLAGLAAAGPLEVEVEALTSAPYVVVTLAAAARFGGRIEQQRPNRFRVYPGLRPPSRLAVEGDASAACYPAAAAALTGGRVEISGLEAASAQGDRRFLDLLEQMGATVRWRPDGGCEVRGGAGLQAVEADLGAMPDQVPTLAALAPFARGTTRISGVPHLRIKESDRLAAMARELRRLGAEVEEHPGGLTIPGLWAASPPPAEPVSVDSHGDHRIAMSLSLTGLRRPGVTVARPEVVGKSYPEYWRHLEALLEPA